VVSNETGGVKHSVWHAVTIVGKVRTQGGPEWGKTNIGQEIRLQGNNTKEGDRKDTNKDNGERIRAVLMHQHRRRGKQECKF
jgi:hypothetical protein